MRPVLLLSTLALMLVAVAAALMSLGGEARASDTTITVGNFYFCDDPFQGGTCEKTVSVGDTVTWSLEAGSATHTITQCDDTFTTCPPSGGFDAGPKSAGQTFSHQFTTAGTFAYHCDIHPTLMMGRIIVVSAATATPTPAPTATAAPGAASPTASPVLPKTGGPPAGGSGAPWALLLLGAGGLLLLAAAGITTRTVRQR